VWYTVVGNGRRLEATTCTKTDLDDDFDSVLSVARGTCSNLATCLGFNDDDPVDQPVGCGKESRYSLDTVDGQRYYIHITAFDHYSNAEDGFRFVVNDV
jgi:hypothetical protein